MEYEKEQEAARAKEAYLTSLESTKTYPAHVIEALRCYDDKDINFELVKALLRYICTSMGNGPILVCSVEPACAGIRQPYPHYIIIVVHESSKDSMGDYCSTMCAQDMLSKISI